MALILSLFSSTLRCAAPIALNAVNREQLLTTTVRHSISRAWRLGKAVLDARTNKTNILNTIIQHENGQVLFTGKVKIANITDTPNK